MSIDDATPDEWDKLKRERWHDNRDYKFKQEDATCTLIRDYKLDKPNFDWDVINNPQHYRVGGEIECIEYIAQQLGSGVKDYLLGNVHKYLHRHRFKGQAMEDLKKAEWYLRRLITEEEQGG